MSSLRTGDWPGGKAEWFIYPLWVHSFTAGIYLSPALTGHLPVGDSPCPAMLRADQAIQGLVRVQSRCLPSLSDRGRGDLEEEELERT